MPFEKPKLHITRSNFSKVVDFHIWQEDKYNDKISIGTSVVMETLEDYSYITTPTFQLSTEATDDLMQQLWNAGFRPRDIGTVGHLSAVTEHLKDIRTILAHFMKGKVIANPDIKTN